MSEKIRITVYGLTEYGANYVELDKNIIRQIVLEELVKLNLVVKIEDD